MSDLYCGPYEFIKIVCRKCCIRHRRCEHISCKKQQCKAYKNPRQLFSFHGSVPYYHTVFSCCLFAWLALFHGIIWCVLLQHQTCKGIRNRVVALFTYHVRYFAWTMTINRPCCEFPIRTMRSSSCEWSGSSIVLDNGSRNAVIASSNETSCVLKSI